MKHPILITSKQRIMKRKECELHNKLNILIKNMYHTKK